MKDFIILILLLAVVAALTAFIIGMFKPQIVKCKTRGKAALVYLLTALGLFILLSIMIPPSEIRETPSQTSTPVAEESPTVVEKTQNQEIESSLGQAIEIGYFTYTIQSVSFRKSVGNEYFKETADGIYMLVDLSIKNISNETRTLDGSMFAVTDENGTKYEFSINASTALEMSGNKTLFLKECQPNITTKGVLVFEVPEKGDYYLHLIGSFWGVKSVQVLLK
ncbi:DUF4352 domain-containing protein [Chryseobacterium sp.]|uniref:DUF4352 domain-containing protein n=1 Tax=Chryseobacterium sp. TaxID=1871047 RepID=UPI002FC5E3DD